MIVAAAVLTWGVLGSPEVLRALAKERPATAPGIRLVQFNTFERNEAWTQARLEWLGEVKPDVITFQEIATEDQALLVALRPSYPYKVTCEIPPHPCPVMILSRKAPVAIGHFSGGSTPQANVAWARFADDAGSYVVMATHLDRPWPDGRQDIQLRRLTGQIAELEEETMVLAGDFNATPWSFALGRFERASRLRRRTIGRPSWPARPVAILPIDHVFAGRRWRTRGIERGPYLGSDHLPIVADLTRR